jgi:hypothetical protein
VFLVCLVPVAVLLLWLQFFRQLLQDRLEQLLLARFVLRISVPNRDLDRVPADRVGDAANVVVEGYCRVSGPSCHSLRQQLTGSLSLNSTLEAVSDSKQAHLMPELCRNVFGNFEVPSSAAGVAWVLPDWLDTQME